jgi:Family of unknown function (DUF6312)
MATMIRFSDAVKRVIIFRPGLSGTLTPTVLYESQNKRKKGSAGVRFFERSVRRATRAQKAYVDEYLRRHNRSNEKKRDGWMRDYFINAARASQKSNKEWQRGL